VENESGKLFEDDAQPVYAASQVGGERVVWCRGMIVAAFPVTDELMRDAAIATLVHGGRGLTTDGIAQLCDVSHGWVCEVRKRFRSGGLEEVLARNALGPPRRLTGKKADRLLAMHGQGVPRKEIAAALGVSESLISKEVKRRGLPRSGWAVRQLSVPGVGDGPRNEPRGAVGEPLIDATDATEPVAPVVADEAQEEQEAPECPEIELPESELGAGVALAPETEHACRYAGTLLVCAAASAIGMPRAIEQARVERPFTAVYDALQMVMAMIAAWVAGYRSLEAMHERDARALGVILGLQRSPSVRTFHRALQQMTSVFDAVQLSAGLIRGLLDARRPERLWFGVDGHFKAYEGDAPIDKGWDTKRRLATTGLMDIVVTDERGWTWRVRDAPAAEALAKGLLQTARSLRSALGDARPIVLAFDRGGFDFEVLNALDDDGFSYVGYVPASVTMPNLSAIAPTNAGVGEEPWEHPRLHHRARLVVERDGAALIPVVTNLTTLVDAVEVMDGLRVRRAAQENSFKAARANVRLDALVDRGAATLAPDDRRVPNPERQKLDRELRQAEATLDALRQEHAGAERSEGILRHEIFWTALERSILSAAAHDTPAKVPKIELDPSAQRATLKTRNRALLQPLKFVAENARRWLLEALGPALAPSDHLHDQETLARTLAALIGAPGWVRFTEKLVTVTLDLPLPPTAHARLAAALESLDQARLRFSDGARGVVFRLAPRPTRASVR
jgi:transposase